MDLASIGALVKDVGILGTITLSLLWYINIKDKNNREDTKHMFKIVETNIKEFKEEKKQEIQELKEERKEDIKMWSKAISVFEEVAKELKISNVESTTKLQTIEKEVKEVKDDVSTIKSKFQ